MKNPPKPLTFFVNQIINYSLTQSQLVLIKLIILLRNASYGRSAKHVAVTNATTANAVVTDAIATNDGATRHGPTYDAESKYDPATTGLVLLTTSNWCHR